MSNNTKIFSEAIAEAKAIRETAMTNAKLALEEAFAPRMQEMMSKKLEAMGDEDEDEEMEEGFTGKKGSMTSNDGDDAMEENCDQEKMYAENDEISLEELIAELDGLEESDHSEKKGFIDPGINDPYKKSLEEAEDEDAVGEITVDELKDIIRSVMNDVMETEEGETPEDETEEDENESEEELNLDEILAELDSLNEGDEEVEMKEAMREPSDSAAAGAAELEKMIKSLADKMGTSFEAAYNKIGNLIHGGKGVGVRESEELEEAMDTISTLRSELNEVNLLNAKLLYVNKLFKSKNLTEAQKVKVINAFDRAETVKETKNIFETLKESLNTSIKGTIKESLSFASKAVGVADRKPIVENNDFVARMQKLAGII